MPFDITFSGLPGGYALNAAREGENVQVSIQGFVSSEDGDKFITYLEGISDSILSQLPVYINPSSIDHLLAIIRPDKTGTVYINELDFIGTLRAKRPVKQGEPILQRDILEIRRTEIRNASIPDDAGFLMIMSSGWRKGFYYDLAPLAAGNPKRDYDLGLLLGQVSSYLMFQSLFKIDSATWLELFKQRWFPFIYLGHPLLTKMVDYARIGWDIDELLPEIQAELGKILVDPNIWRTNPCFEPHLTVLDRAIERYQADDYVSAAAILYPRIEGVMRSYFTSAGFTEKPSAPNLARTVVQKGAAEQHSCCLFLPERFHEYLNQVYFAHFTPGTRPNVARHSVAHGEARAEDFSLKSSAIGFLTLYQVALFLSPDSKGSRKEEDDPDDAQEEESSGASSSL